MLELFNYCIVKEVELFNYYMVNEIGRAPVWWRSVISHVCREKG